MDVLTGRATDPDDPGWLDMLTYAIRNPKGAAETPGVVRLGVVADDLDAVNDLIVKGGNAWTLINPTEPIPTITIGSAFAPGVEISIAEQLRAAAGRKVNVHFLDAARPLPTDVLSGGVGGQPDAVVLPGSQPTQPSTPTQPAKPLPTGTKNPGGAISGGSLPVGQGSAAPDDASHAPASTLDDAELWRRVPTEHRPALAERLLLARAGLPSTAKLLELREELEQTRVEFERERVIYFKRVNADAAEHIKQREKWRSLADRVPGLLRGCLIASLLLTVAVLGLVFLKAVDGWQAGLLIFVLAVAAVSPTVLLLLERPLTGIDTFQPPGSKPASETTSTDAKDADG